jgi:serine/threonine protein kinase
MVSPYMREGTIIDHLVRNDFVNVEERVSSLPLSYVPRSHQVIFLFKLFEVAQGLEYLHSEDVVHGDLRGVSDS